MKKRRNVKSEKNKYRPAAFGILILAIVFLIKKISAGGWNGLLSGGIRGVIPILFLPLGLFLLLFGNVIGEKEEQKKRTEELKNSYPEFALKVSMLIHAGFTVRGAFEKVGRNYLRKKEKEKTAKNPLYEEVVISLREMESGVSQNEAYEHFEKRCNVFEITRFTGLLIRAVKRGSSSLGEELKEESRKATLARQELVRRKGETAGTRLYFPMILFLLIVMVMILYPAFSSLSSI